MLQAGGGVARSESEFRTLALCRVQLTKPLPTSITIHVIFCLRSLVSACVPPPAWLAYARSTQSSGMSRSDDQVRLQTTPNRTIGSLILLSTLTLFGLYTLWTIVLPFLPDDSPVHTWIPDRRWAITLPSLVLVVGLTTVGVYAGLLLREDALHQLAQEKPVLQK